MPKGPREKSRGPFFVQATEPALVGGSARLAAGRQGAAALEVACLGRPKSPTPWSPDFPAKGLRHPLQAQLPYQDAKYLKSGRL